ncbi:hypothetical protein AAY473_011830 [Plecturocebus cupreus]
MASSQEGKGKTISNGPTATAAEQLMWYSQREDSKAQAFMLLKVKPPLSTSTSHESTLCQGEAVFTGSPNCPLASSSLNVLQTQFPGLPLDVRKKQQRAEPRNPHSETSTQEMLCTECEECCPRFLFPAAFLPSRMNCRPAHALPASLKTPRTPTGTPGSLLSTIAKAQPSGFRLWASAMPCGRKPLPFPVSRPALSDDIKLSQGAYQSNWRGTASLPMRHISIGIGIGIAIGIDIGMYVAQAGLELLGSSNPPASASQRDGIMGKSHCTWLIFY